MVELTNDGKQPVEYLEFLISIRSGMRTFRQSYVHTVEVPRSKMWL